MAPPYDAIVIGGGHNGLVAAAYLARAGRRTLVLEAAPQVGGAAINRELAPGFTVPACAHLLHGLHARVARDLDLARHGLSFAARDVPTFALSPDGAHLSLQGAALPPCDAETWPRLQARMGRFAAMLAPFLATTPPRIASGRRSDTVGLAKLAWALRRLGRADMREFLRIAAMNIWDVLEESLESDLLKGAIAFDAVLGTDLGARSPNSVLALLYRMASQAAGAVGGIAQPTGGMGAVTAALGAAARAAGAEIRVEAPVAHILVAGDRASGVVLETGEEIAARTVVSNADPRTTFLDLLGTAHLDTGFVRRVANIRMRGMAAKLHLALDGPPPFRGLDGTGLGTRLLIAPDMRYLEHAFNHGKYGEHSSAPAMEITVPSIRDPGLAPAGKHVLSAIVQYAPHDLKGGWDEARNTFAETAIRTLETYAPGIRDLIIARELATPADLARDFRMTGGHWHHGELAPDQLFVLRPVPGCAQYATPMPGLYLCGAGSHPGGGVTGVPGMNAAHQVIAMESRA